jgi:hypothetical protein
MEQLRNRVYKQLDEAFAQNNHVVVGRRDVAGKDAVALVFESNDFDKQWKTPQLPGSRLVSRLGIPLSLKEAIEEEDAIEKWVWKVTTWTIDFCDESGVPPVGRRVFYETEHHNEHPVVCLRCYVTVAPLASVL